MEAGPPPELRFLKLLVGALALVMISGIIAIVALLALRLQGQPTPLALPAGLELPESARAEALSFGRNWVVVLTEQGEALVYDRETRELRQRITLGATPQGGND